MGRLVPVRRQRADRGCDGLHDADDIFTIAPGGVIVTLYVDGTAKGTATLGAARPDVATVYPNLAPPNSGWTYALAYIRQFG